jgi:tetratricopeptide (TPR) repeat protein
MGIFRKLFDKKPESSGGDKSSVPPSDPANDPNLIRVFDKYGQEFFISKEEWRTQVLPGAIRSQWNNPDELYGTIVSALNDGFGDDVLPAAEQLYRLEPDASRAACVYGIVLTENKQLDEAERVFRSFLYKHGEDGTVLTNLAKVYAERNEGQLADDTLWHALEVDPNQDNGLGWYEALQRERFGEEAGLKALRRIASLPGSWRAQVWLARHALKSQNLEQALDYYRESLSRSEKNIPADLLMQISGDLGNQGHLRELLELTEPHFMPEYHGLQVGNNLIKAHLDLGHVDAARRVLDQLYSLKRPDYRETLSYWDTAIAKARLPPSSVDPEAPLDMHLLLFEGPVWLKPSSAATKLFPLTLQESPTIGFLGSSAETPSTSTDIRHQLSDEPGRLSRALPLFLAEQVTFSCQAKAQVVIPWISGASLGLILSGVPWTDEFAVTYLGHGEIKSDYIVVTHLKTQTDQWTVELRLLRTSDGQGIGKLESLFSSSNPGTGVQELSRQLVAMLVELADTKAQPSTALYRLPDPEWLDNYLLRLEQLLAVRCAAMDGVSPSFLSGEREIINGNLELCLACPDNVPARILLTQTLLTMNRIKPEIVQEFSEKVALLQQEQPLSEPAQTVIQGMLSELNSS